MCRFILSLLIFITNVVTGSQISDSLHLRTLNMDTTLNYTPDSILFLFWNTDSDSWEYHWKEELTYNTNGQKLQQFKFNWNLNYWEPFTETYYEYSNTILNKKETYKWDDYELGWFPESRYNFGYNELGQLHEIVDSKWDYSQSEWKSDSITTYLYTESGEVELSTVIIWSDIFQTWENNTETLYQYNNNLTTQQILSIWDFDQLYWDAKKINHFEYDVNQLMSVQYQTVINTFHTQWLNNWKREYDWNAQKLLIKETEWDWNTSDSIWLQTYQTNYLYDNQNNVTYQTLKYFDYYYLDWINLYQTEFRYYNNQKLIESTLYYWNFSQWNPTYRYSYYYPDYTKVPESINEICHVYPNPASDLLYINFDKVEQSPKEIHLMDLSGKTIKTYQPFNTSNPIELQLPDITNGVYILKIVTGTDSKNAKVVIKR